MLLSVIYMLHIQLGQSFQTCKLELDDLQHIVDKLSHVLNYFVRSSSSKEILDSMVSQPVKVSYHA